MLSRSTAANENEEDRVAGNEGHGATLGGWVATVVIIAGFTLGGVALVIHTWWLFWASVAICVVGGVVARAVNIMEQVTEYDMPTPEQTGERPPALG